jgi:hypothetical protein
VRPSERTLKELFARSGNRCPFPKCQALLAFNGTLIGEVCHIKGNKPGAARYDVSQTDAERQAYDNLIAMCPTHHTVIDDDEVSYPFARLLRIKADHERRVEALAETEAQAIVTNYLARDFSNIGQSGGIAAQSIHAQTITLNHTAPVDPLTQRRQIEAAEKLWRAVRALRGEFHDLVDYVEWMLTADEIDEHFRSGWPARLNSIRDYAREAAISDRYIRAQAMKIETERPFVSSRVWNVYFIVRALHGRLAYLYQQSFAKMSYQDWRVDNGTDQLLRAVLPSNVVEDVKSRNISGLTMAFDHLEAQFLAEANMRAL